MNKLKNTPNISLNLNLPFELTMADKGPFAAENGHIHMTIEAGTVKTNGEQRATISFCVGGALEIDDLSRGETWYLPLQPVWDQYCKAREALNEQEALEKSNA